MSRYTTTPAAKHRAQWAAEHRAQRNYSELVAVLREIEPWFDTWITEFGPAEDALIERIRAILAKVGASK